MIQTNLDGHQNHCIGSKVTAILMNGWILPTGGASWGRFCVCSLRSRLVSLFLNTKVTTTKNLHPQKREYRNIFTVKKSPNLKPACFYLYCDIITFKFLPQNRWKRRKKEQDKNSRWCFNISKPKLLVWFCLTFFLETFCNFW